MGGGEETPTARPPSAPAVAAGVVELLRTTGIHRLEDEGVQYALAVAVFPYPSDVLSVWVYAATLLPVINAA